MRTQDDDFPYTSDDPSLAPVEEENTVISLSPQQLGDLKATMRLAVGSALNGSDAYIQRLRQIQAMQVPVKPETVIVDEDETFHDQLKYALLGILFETPDLIQHGLMTAERASSKVYGLFSKILSPFTDSRIFRPVKNRYDTAAGRGEKVIDRLIMKGRVEEQNSRQIVQQKNVDELVNDFLEYIVLRTEIRQLIQEEGIDVAGDVVYEFQEQSAAVDTTLERKLKSLFRKNVSSNPDTPPSNLPKGA
jgi:polyhydroxyalkanoate synthesis regulator phasin